MPLHLKIQQHEQRCHALLADRLLADTAWSDLPSIDQVLADPVQTGKTLFAALGGQALQQLLNDGDHEILLIELADSAHRIPWEYAWDGRQLLACQYSLLRLVPRKAKPVKAGPARLLLQFADPLVDAQGNSSHFRLDFQSELAELKQALQHTLYNLQARRVPPSDEALFAAISQNPGPSLLHFSCHGTTIEISNENGTYQEAALVLENQIGAQNISLETDLLNGLPKQSVRLALFSACQTAPLAHSFAQNGIPMAIGMQHNFPDAQSAKLCAAFYHELAQGQNIAEALRLARNKLFKQNPTVAGMLVAYTCQAGWQPLELAAGNSILNDKLSQNLFLPESLQAPSEQLVGRELHLAALAYQLQESKAVTIVGAGGIGKTVLAQGFIQRFAWSFLRVLGVSFASQAVDLGQVCRALLEQIGAAEQIRQAQQQAEQQREKLINEHQRRLQQLQLQKSRVGYSTEPHILNEIEDIERELAQLKAPGISEQHAQALQEALLQHIQANDLVLFDNYESVLSPSEPDQEQANAIRRLLQLLQDRQVRLLLTSRNQPAGLRHEALFPNQAGLSGLDQASAIELFLQHSQRARVQAPELGRKVAQQVAQATHGYPLAIVLLASSYEQDYQSSQQFADEWASMLAQAEHKGLPNHHHTMAVAIKRSIAALSPQQQQRLLLLSYYDLPFFAQGAALIWDLPSDEDGVPSEAALNEAKADLQLFLQRSLIQVEGWFKANEEGERLPATYQFQPVIRQALQQQAKQQLALSAPPTGYYAYAAWFVKKAYGNIHSDFGLARLALQNLPFLAAATEQLQGDARLWYSKWLAWLYQHYGELSAAQQLLEHALLAAEAQSKVQSSLQYELAQIYQTRGRINEALDLLQQALETNQKLDNQRDVAATQHAIAEIHAQRGQFEQALTLFQQLLETHQTLGDQREVAATQHAIAEIYLQRGQFEQALALFQQSLEIKQKLGNQRGVATTQHAIAEIYRQRGQFDAALTLFQQSLETEQKLGDQRGVAATLSAIANVLMQQQAWQAARQHLQAALLISLELGLSSDVAFNQVKLGQIAQAQADFEQALVYFQIALARFQQLGMPREIAQVQEFIADLHTAQAEHQALFTAISDWLSHFAQPSDTSVAELVQLLNSCANKTVTLIRAAGHDAAWQLADALVPLRLRLQTWPSNLPPFNAMFGCLQALLRNQPAQLARLRKRLDPDFSQALTQIEQNIQAERIDPTQLQQQAQQQTLAQIAQLREQLNQAMPQALLSDDPEECANLAGRLEQIAEQRSAEEAAGSPWLDFAAMLRACVAVLRGQSYDPATLLPEDAAQVQAWQQLAQADPEQRAAVKEQARQQQITQLREQLLQAIPQALLSDDPKERAKQANGLEQMAEQAAADEEAGSPWLDFATMLRACVAVLRGQSYDPATLLPEDAEQVQAWQQLAQADPEERNAAKEQAHQQQIAQLREELEQAMPQALLSDDPEECANLANDLQEMAEQAAAGEEAGSPWLDFAAMLRACVAVLRGQSYDPATLLPEDAAQVQAWQELAQADPEQRAAVTKQARQQQIAQLREQLLQAMPQALLSDDPEECANLANDLQEMAEQAAAGEEAGSPWLDFAAMLRACVALLRGQSYDSATLLPEDAEQIQAWQEFVEAQLPDAIVEAWQSGDQAAIQQLLAGLSSGEQKRALVWIAQQQVEAMSPEQREAAIEQARQQQIATIVEQSEQAMQSALQSNDPAERSALQQRFEQVANQLAEGEEEGSDYAKLALYLRALAAILRNEQPTAVPAAYQQNLAQIVALSLGV